MQGELTQRPSQPRELVLSDSPPELTPHSWNHMLGCIQCDEVKPVCSSCVRARSEVSRPEDILPDSPAKLIDPCPPCQCLYPLDLPNELLFQPYERRHQVIASTSYLAPPSATPPPAAAPPVNAVASSSRTSPSVPSDSTPEWTVEDESSMYIPPPGVLEIAYPDPEERHLVRTDDHEMLRLAPPA